MGAKLALVFSLALIFVLSGQATMADDLLTQVHSKWAWSTYGTEVGANGFAVEDLNGDGRSEILAATSLYSLDWWYQVNFSDRLLQTWSSFPIEGEEMELRGLELAQTTGGSFAVMLTENAVEVFEAASKRHLYDFETLSTDNCAMAVADLTGDGSLEAIVCDSQDLTVYDLATGTVMSFKAGYGCTDVAIGQVDNDSQLEIALAGNPFAGYVLDGLTLLLNGGDLLGFENRVALGDVNADGRDEVIFKRNSNLRAQDAVTGQLLWQHSVPPSWFGLAFSIAEMNSSPGLEVVVGRRILDKCASRRHRDSTLDSPVPGFSQCNRYRRRRWRWPCRSPVEPRLLFERRRDLPFPRKSSGIADQNRPIRGRGFRAGRRRFFGNWRG